jgi:hypothetical protein
MGERRSDPQLVATDGPRALPKGQEIADHRRWHRLFSFITGNWRGKPLVSHQAIVELIAATTTNGWLHGSALKPST